jgi:hypothetical protein
MTCNPNGTNRYCNPNGPEGPRCQSCLTDEHCATNTQNPPRLYCDTNGAGSCRSCLNDMHCMPPNRCITGNNNNTCQLRCASDADCATAPNNNRACNPTTMTCVQCQNNTHCVGNTSGPVCVDDSCEQCGVDTDCTAPGLPICDAGNNTCVQCRDNAQCAEPTPICVTTGANTCRECGSNTHCAGRPGGPACVMNVCRQCSGSAPCPAGNNCVMNTCVPVPEAGTPDAPPDVSQDVPPDVSDDAEGGADDAEAGSPDAEGGVEDGEAGSQDAEGGSNDEGGPPDGGVDAADDANNG